MEICLLTAASSICLRSLKRFDNGSVELTISEYRAVLPTKNQLPCQVRVVQILSIRPYAFLHAGYYSMPWLSPWVTILKVINAEKLAIWVQTGISICQGITRQCLYVTSKCLCKYYEKPQNPLSDIFAALKEYEQFKRHTRH